MVTLPSLAPYLDTFFTLALGQAQLYGLFFLLGTFTVATLSDLRHMAAQREFFQVWVVFAVAMLAFDVHAASQGLTTQSLRIEVVLLALKWGPLAVLAVLSYERVGVLFRLARADVAAMAATAALLTPGLILIFWGLLKVFDLVERPVLARGGSAYPFMPVVTSATLAILALGFLLGTGAV